MHALNLDANNAPQTQRMESRRYKFMPGTAATILVLASVLLLGIGFTAWGMLRAQFTETFSEFPACQTVALDRTA